MMGVKEGLLLWFTYFSRKSEKAVVLLIMRLNKMFSQLKNYTNQLLEILKKEQFILDIDNKKKKIVLGIRPTQVLEHTLTAEKMYSINFTVNK